MRFITFRSVAQKFVTLLCRKLHGRVYVEFSLPYARGSKVERLPVVSSDLDVFLGGEDG